MDKKIAYYIIAAVIVVVIIIVVVVMQIQPAAPVTTGPAGGEAATKTQEPVKSETQAALEVAKQLNGKGLRITMDDNGQTVSLTPGNNLILMLGTDYNWTINTSDASVLAKKDITLSDSRMQAVYQVSQAGKAVLSATGDCKATCASPTQSFSLNVEAVISDDVPAADLVK